MRGVPLPPRRLLAVGILSFGLNAAGLGWGLPARFHPDEKADVAAWMLSEGRLVPGSFINPSLPLTVMAPVIAVQQRLAPAVSLPDPWGDPLFAGRLLSALAGAAAVVLLGLAVASAQPEGGLLAALLLALSPGVVNLAHFATPEAWVLMTTAGVLLAAVQYVNGRTNAVVVGVALGLAAATKYTAAALVAPALAALWLRPRGPVDRRDRIAWIAAGSVLIVAGGVLLGPAGQGLASSLGYPDPRLLPRESAVAFVQSVAWAMVLSGAVALAFGLLAGSARGRLLAPFVRREVVLAGVAALGGFLIGTPGALASSRQFLTDLAFNAQTRHEYKGFAGEGTSYVPYLGLLADALTLPVLAAALLGLGVAAYRAWGRDRAAALPIAGFVAPYLLVASSGHQAMRFAAVAFPAAAWAAALTLTSFRSRRIGRVLTVAVCARAAIACLLVVRLFFVDSRLLAERWMSRHVSPGDTVDLITNHEGYAPRVPEGRHVRLVRTLSREMAPRERFVEAASRYPSEASPWLVLTAAFYERFVDHPEQAPERARFFSDLLEGRGGFEVAARFRQEGWLRPAADEFLDPEIVVLRRVDSTTSGGGQR